MRRCNKRRSVAYSGTAPPGIGDHRDIAMCAEASTSAYEGADGFEITASLTAVSGSPTTRASVDASSTMCVSSLRVRGTGLVRVRPTDPRRVIAACAGNRARPASFCVLPPCHPCVCREHLQLLEDVIINIVSSLRVRGTGIVRVRPTDPRRVIPACAGNRLCDVERNRV